MEQRKLTRCVSYRTCEVQSGLPPRPVKRRPDYHLHLYSCSRTRQDAADMVLFSAGTMRLATGGDPTRLVVSPFP